MIAWSCFLFWLVDRLERGVPDLNYSRLYQKLQVTILKDEYNVVAVAWPDKRNGGVMHAQGKRMEQTLSCQRSITV